MWIVAPENYYQEAEVIKRGQEKRGFMLSTKLKAIFIPRVCEEIRFRKHLQTTPAAMQSKVRSLTTEQQRFTPAHAGGVCTKGYFSP